MTSEKVREISHVSVKNCLGAALWSHINFYKHLALSATLFLSSKIALTCVINIIICSLMKDLAHMKDLTCR